MADNALAIADKFPEDKYTLLIPIRTVAEIADIQMPVMNVVFISTDLNDKEVYEQEKSWNDTKGYMHEVKYALSKRGLTKLMKAAGIKIVKSESSPPSTCQKCADVNRNLEKAVSCHKCGNKDVKYTVTVNVPQLTGENINVIGTKEIIVDEVLESMGDKEKQKKEFIKYKSEICESKALNRALRSAMNIKGTYTLKELKKPFVVAYLVPNLNQPDVRRAAIQSMMNSSNNLFGTFNNCLGADKQAVIDNRRDNNYEPNDIKGNEFEPETEQQENDSQNIDKYICCKCGAKISDKVSKYSIEHKGSPLCMNCQRGA